MDLIRNFKIHAAALIIVVLAELVVYKSSV